MNALKRIVPLVIVALGMLGCGGGQAREDRDFSTSGSRDADQRAAQRIAKDQQLKGEGASVSNEKKPLYDRLGGEKGMTQIVDDFVTRAIADPRVNWERKGVKRGGLNIHRGQSVEWKPTDENVAKLKKHLSQFLALATGGPTVYEGAEMKGAHANMHITNAEFDAAIGDMKATLDKLSIATPEQKEVLAILESTRPQIVEER